MSVRMVGQQRMKEGPSDVSNESGPLSATPGSPKTRLAMLKRSSTKSKPSSNSDPFRFQGNGVDFKAKLIGVRDVEEARGDTMCAEAMRLAKAIVKSSGQHKQRVILNISIDGIKIKDEKNLTTLHNFPVSRVSFIARDVTDARAFGFIFCASDNQYKFYGVKTAQTADHAVLSIRDMFQIVFEMKKAHLAQVKQKQEENENKKITEDGVRIDNGVAVADLLDLESELHNIEQGVNQLQNIPAFAEDSWPNAELKPQSFAFIPQPTFALSSPSTVTSGSSSDPFGDSFAPPPSIPPIMAPASQPPLSPLSSSVPWTQLNGVHSAPNFRSNTFSDTNPFVSTMQSQPSTADPFDTQPALRFIESISMNQRCSSVNWTTKENSAPVAAFDSSRSPMNWNDQPRKVPSLEEAITKLVDMDALVSSPEIKTNPFKHYINPPKVPLSAMTGGPHTVPTRSPATLVFPGAQNDPFNDDFFN